MPQLDIYLTFNGNCADAMRFYERTLNGKLEMLMTHAESPIAAQAPPGSADRIMHARLVIDGRVLMASDSMVGQPYEGMKGFSLSLIYPTVADAQRVFDALAKGGQVHMPLQKMFWAEAFGMLVDHFGTPWMINGGMASS
jgi:PhnB protein